MPRALRSRPQGLWKYPLLGLDGPPRIPLTGYHNPHQRRDRRCARVTVAPCNGAYPQSIVVTDNHAIGTAARPVRNLLQGRAHLAKTLDVLTNPCYMYSVVVSLHHG